MKVIRQLRADENPAQGLYAKNPEANYKLPYHVSHGSTKSLKTQYISATDNIETMFRYKRSQRRWCIIDTNKIGNDCQFFFHDEVDTSNWYFWPKKLWNVSRESVFVGHIPAEACTLIIDDSNGDIELTDEECKEIAMFYLKEE